MPPTRKAVTSVLEKLFETFGIPEIVHSDGGPQFRSEFQEWYQNWGIKPEQTRPDSDQTTYAPK